MKRMIKWSCMLLASCLALSCEKDAPAEFKLIDKAISVAVDGGDYTLKYELTNPAEGVSITFAGQPEWIAELADMESSIKVTILPNENFTERKCEFDVIYDKFTEKVSVTQAANIRPGANFEVSAEASSEFEVSVTISVALGGGNEESLISEYGFIYAEGSDVIENGTKVAYPYSEKGSSFTEVVECLMPDNVLYGILPYMKYSDGKEAYGELYEYTHYWEERTKLYDIQGNEYPVCTSGGRYWMGADLKVELYNDGTHIPNITDNTEWVETNDGAYCYYDNNKEEYVAIYGALYNYAAATSGKICPKGWSLPTSQEWKDLAVSQGGKENHDEYGDYFPALGVKFKTEEYWTDNKKGKNTFGFNAVPGGCRKFNDGDFNVMGTVAYWWSADEIDTDNAIVYYIRAYNFANVTLGKQGGFSVRCIRDVEQ